MRLSIFLTAAAFGMLSAPLSADEALDFENEEFGAEVLNDLSAHTALGAFTCVECGRCRDHCPTAATDKVLNPTGYGQQKGGSSLEFIVPHGEDGFTGMFVRRQKLLNPRTELRVISACLIEETGWIISLDRAEEDRFGVFGRMSHGGHIRFTFCPISQCAIWPAVFARRARILGEYALF